MRIHEKKFIPLLRGLLLFLLATSTLSVFSEEDNNGEDDKNKESSEEIQKKETDKKNADEITKKEKEEAEIKVQFNYSLNDILDKLVIINCSGKNGRSAGSGFIAKMDGKSYLFTNQHVIFGTDRISFKTIEGKTLKPRGVELSQSRDIARLLLADDVEGFEISEKVLMDAPIAIFGNSEGGGVATELYGKTTGIGADLVEVSAEFVSGNSGSPVLDRDQKVIGIASYVRFASTSRITKGTRFENKTRRFCYRISGNEWVKVNWKSYNEKYGKAYVANEQFVNGVIHIFEQWGEDVKGTIELSASSSRRLENWVQSHNALIAAKNRQGSRRSFLGKYVKSTKSLSHICTTKANQIRLFSKDRNLTDFLRNESETQVYTLETVEDGCKYIENLIYQDR
jgi:hypothetical protein